MKTITKLLDTLKNNKTNTKTVMARLRKRKKIAKQIKGDMAALESRRDALKVKTLNATVVAEAYAKLPTLLDEAERAGARQKLKTLLQSIIQVIEWRQNPNNPKNHKT